MSLKMNTSVRLVRAASQESLSLEAEFLKQRFMQELLEMKPEEILQVTSELYTQLLVASQTIRKLRDSG